jgi:putative ABC transport system substrate-binding protein
MAMRCRTVALAAFTMVLLAGSPAAVKGAAQELNMAIITLAGVEAYAQTLEGIHEQLPDVPVWDAGDEMRLREKMGKQPPRLAIAVGSTAAAVLGRIAPPQLVLVGSVVMESDLENGSGNPTRFRTAVIVDIPPGVLFGEVARFFPGRNRVGVIRGPMQTDGYMKTVEQAARRNGISLQVAVCQHPRDLVDCFLKFRSRIDLVWCPANAQLYNSATLKPLLIASLNNRLAIIGFSEQFVQAGALFGASADFVEVGRQVAAVALRVAHDEAVPARVEARRFHFAYNQRVARLLGVTAAAPQHAGGDLMIFR